MWFIMCACSSFCYTFVYFAFVKVQFCAWFACFVILRWQNNDICISFVCDYWIWVYRLWLFVVLFSIWFPICSLREAILQSRVCEGRGRGTIERDVCLLPRRVFLPHWVFCPFTGREALLRPHVSRRNGQRVRACARIRCFSFFAFTSSPLDGKNLIYSV